MFKNRIKILWALTILVGFSLACESFSAISQDYDEARSTAGAIVTQAKGIATQLVDSDTFGTARAFATEQGPAVVATGQAFATQAYEGGYLQTVEALVTQGSSELLPTFQAIATQYLFPAPPPDDIPIITIGEVTNLFTNQATVSYFVDLDLPLVVDFYQDLMPELGWIDVSDENSILAEAAIMKFFKPERVATVTLTSNPLNQQTVVLITITSQ